MRLLASRACLYLSAHFSSLYFFYNRWVTSGSAQLNIHFIAVFFLCCIQPTLSARRDFIALGSYMQFACRQLGRNCCSASEFIAVKAAAAQRATIFTTTRHTFYHFCLQHFFLFFIVIIIIFAVICVVLTMFISSGSSLAWPTITCIRNNGHCHNLI